MEILRIRPPAPLCQQVHYSLPYSHLFVDPDSYTSLTYGRFIHVHIHTDSAHRRRMSEEEVHRSVAERSSANAREVKYMPDNIDLNKKGENNFYSAYDGAISLKCVCVVIARSKIYTYTYA